MFLPDLPVLLSFWMLPVPCATPPVKKPDKGKADNEVLTTDIRKP